MSVLLLLVGLWGVFNSSVTTRRTLWTESSSLRTRRKHKMSRSPSWTLCRGRTLWGRAGSLGSCSHSGPPALCSTSPRTRPHPPGGAAAPPLIPPSLSTRCHIHAAPLGTLVEVKDNRRGFDGQTRNENKKSCGSLVWSFKNYAVCFWLLTINRDRP